MDVQTLNVQKLDCNIVCKKRDLSSIICVYFLNMI
jgi:hypothetical protein